MWLNLWWREEGHQSIAPDFTTKSRFLFNSKKLHLMGRMAIRYPLFEKQNHSLNKQRGGAIFTTLQ
jgi:hypothetical protein